MDDVAGGADGHGEAAVFGAPFAELVAPSLYQHGVAQGVPADDLDALTGNLGEGRVREPLESAGVRRAAALQRCPRGLERGREDGPREDAVALDGDAPGDQPDGQRQQEERQRRPFEETAHHGPDARDPAWRDHGPPGPRERPLPRAACVRDASGSRSGVIRRSIPVAPGMAVRR